MSRFMLDTNTISFFVREHTLVKKRIVGEPMSSLCISAVTEGELLFGLARRPDAVRLAHAVQEFLRRVEVLAWDSSAAARYAICRADLEKTGQTLGTNDLLIGAHALSMNATLITNDQAFKYLAELRLEDWTK